MYRLSLIALLCLICWTSLVATADAKLFLSLYATGGGYSFANEQDISSDYLSGFKVALDFEGPKGGRQDFSLEGSYNLVTGTNDQNGESLDTSVVRLDIVYPLINDGKWRPFLTVGAGMTFFDGQDKPDDEDIVAYGLGLKYLLTDYLILRAEGRHLLLYNRDEGNIDNYEYTASIGYTFGKRKPRKKKPEPIPEPEPEVVEEPKISDDDDMDGVKNPVDRCPGTPAGIQVDSRGCAPQTPADDTALIEEVIPAEAPPAAIVVTPTPQEPVAIQEEVVTTAPKPAPVQEDAPPAFVLPALPTVIAIPEIPVGEPALEPEAETAKEPPLMAAESSALPAQQQQPVPLSTPGTADAVETPVSADSAAETAAVALSSSALPEAGQLPAPLPVPPLAVVAEPPAEVNIPAPVEIPQPAAEPPTAIAATEEPDVAPLAAPALAAGGLGLAAAPTGPISEPTAQAAPITIPECSGLPPHAILMLGRNDSELLHVSVDDVQEEPVPFNAQTTVAKKSHVPTASFEFDVWQLSDQAKQVLSILVKQLQNSELDFAIRVEGHTDSLGSDAYNYNLSLLRANAVATFLTDVKGLDPQRVSTAGCGEWKPLASNDTDDGRKLNRRFELVILPAEETE